MNGAAGETHAPPRGLLRRLAKTPLRDLVRGRLTARLDVQHLLDQAALPSPLPELVRTVVRRTRLWRLEKADVAAELIGHFKDGLDADESPEALARGFGDPQLVSRLIRRARKRNRPKAWHALRYARNAIIVLVLVYLGLGLYLLAGKPNPTTDYLTRVNAVAAAVPEADRAWPLYRAALLALEPRPTFRGLSRQPMPGEVGWDEVETYLARQQEALAIARDASLRPGLGFIVGHEIAEADRPLWPDQAGDPGEWIGQGSLMSILLPNLADLRRMSMVLALDAWRAAAAGDGERVAADLSAILSIARHVRETPFVINDLVAFALVALASRTTGDLLAEYPDVLDDRRLRRLAHQLSAMDEVLTVRLEGERWGFEDLVQRMYTDNGSGDGRFTLRGLRMMTSVSNANGSNVSGPGLSDVGESVVGVALTPAMTAVLLSRRELLDEHARVMDMAEAEAARPMWEQGPSQADALVEQWAGSWIDRFQRLPIVLLMPALSKVPRNCELTIAQRDTALTVVALHSYRLRHGSWPTRLEDLVPEHLPQVPADRFTGTPMRYLADDEAPMLYSTGPDRDDDGGRPPMTAGGQPLPEAELRWQRQMSWMKPVDAADGDWILWPRPVEELIRYE